MFIKKSLLLKFIFSFLQLWTTHKSRNIQISKKSKRSLLVAFIDFYCLINTKFWITNEIMFIKKLFLVMPIASFLQLWTTNKKKTLKNQKVKKVKKIILVTFIAWLIQNFGLQIRKCW